MPSTQDDASARLDASPYKGARGLRRVLRATRYSARGFAFAYRNEAAFRQEVLIGAVLAVVALFTNADGIGKALMIGSLLLVLVVELLNSAIEAVVDRVSLDAHPLSGMAKDLGSAAVFVALMNVLVVWGFVLLG